MQRLFVLLIGVMFGIVLTKSEVISWFRIQKMFRFEEAHMYLIIASAVLVGAISVFLIKRFNLKTIQGEPITIKEKKWQKGVVIGGIIFGLGWAITGACPGPIYAQIGAGTWLALATFAGALVGAYLFAVLQPKLPT
ncbi:MAG: YeeE/YedE thiosulfate transporter family protein [Anaerolineae bacterium]|nr:YeeE/YedE family protein [Candidatus Roseilinea sp.]MDW8448462.1 YeeE/YedE thiosulfate transporter family protein [Anaerolineae bacterium]